MSWNSYGWRPYVPVAKRRAQAARERAKLNQQTGLPSSAVVLSGRKIAATFWGKAWCDNLEAYSDYANRLPRGRTYVRNGSVVDLQIRPGTVTARVAGSSLYQIEIKIKPLAPSLWKSIQSECAGQIDSLMELLQGKLSAAVMQIVTRKERGLFPTPKEIELACSCPDWADLCKHVAASLYGVGSRLDQNPGLLFLLRGVEPADLIGQASAAAAVRQTTGSSAPALNEADLADVFGIELAPRDAAAPPAAAVSAPPPLNPAPTPAPAPQRRLPRKPKTIRRLSAPARAKIAAAQKARWEKLKQQLSAKTRKLAARTPRTAKADRSQGKVKTAQKQLRP